MRSTELARPSPSAARTPPGGGFLARLARPIMAVLLSFGFALPVVALALALGASKGAAGTLGTAVGSGLMLSFASLFWFVLPRHERRLTLSTKGNRWLAFGLGGAVGLALVAGSVVVVAAGAAVDSRVADRLEERTIDIGSDPWQTGVMVVALVILAPLGEELVFRGLLLRTVVRRTGFWAAAAISGVAFGAAHIDAYDVWPRWIALALTGVALAFLYRRRGYAAAVAAHATVNGIAAIALLNS